MSRLVRELPSNLVRLDDNNLDELGVVNIIMLQENYLLALINQGHLDLNLPILGSVMTKALEWGLRIALFGYIFRDKKLCLEILDKKNTSSMASSLRRRFILFGVVGFLLSPFVLIGVVIYFIFKYGELIKNKPGQILGLRNWSSMALWKFRDYNELPHVFRKRLSKSYTPANEYIDLFTSHTVVLLARFVSFAIGSILAVIIIFSLYDEQFVLKGHLFEGEVSLLLLVGLLGTILASVRQVIPPKTFTFEPNKVLLRVSIYTHYFPNHWRNREGSSEILSEFLQLFPYSIYLWFLEAMGIIIAPLQMCTTLANSSEQIVQFFRDHSVLHGSQYICRFATFDLKECGSLVLSLTGGVGKGDDRENGEGEDKLERGLPSSQSVGGSPLDPMGDNLDLYAIIPPSSDGKLEHSVINFHLTYPSWQPNEKSRPEIDLLYDIMNRVNEGDEGGGWAVPNVDGRGGGGGGGGGGVPAPADVGLNSSHPRPDKYFSQEERGGVHWLPTQRPVEITSEDVKKEAMSQSLFRFRDHVLDNEFSQYS
eukprot:TRINITY_DN1480_c0_g1_i3.p1 TRINITY_DN1480_c0_g1~~TRINITY_DN1480_c0_g1_i3.p1  ORF type:complete len:538 (+),score=95.40 TRINITY_DN1480_c0_g1_i3:832-2445(+)